MSTRPPRQPERDIRLHDPHVSHHAHSLPPPTHPHAHPMHMNGGSIPNTPLAPGAAPPPQAVMAASPAMPNGANGTAPPTSMQKLAQANEQTWLLIGRVAEQMGNLELALSAYENALRHNPMSLSGLTQVAGIARIKENYPKAVEYFQRVLNMQQDNGEVWSALGHCYLMQDDLQKAYAAYQQALYLLPNPKEDPKLWYGIGILYDRYGSLDHAEEAFSSVLRMDKVALDFDKANEILFRLGIIYKQQGKYTESLDCFDRILRNPPNPLAHADIWFQIGHVYEQQHDHVRAREAYERVVADNPGHAKVLQQLGWLYHQDGSSFQNQELAIQYLTKSLEADPADAQSWYLLGRAYMAGQKYNKAYEAYQQAVYRDGRNPTFWCSIGVLYFQINQYRDALDAYSRAIRINPYISEVWFDLGSLYESCNNQISDAIDAYARAAELDPTNQAIAQRLQLLKNAQATGQSLPAAPGPQDVHPTAYANTLMPQPAGLSGPPLLLHTNGGPPRPLFRTESRGAPNDLPLPIPPAQLPGRTSPGPFGGRPPPPVILDDSQRPSSHALAPMDVGSRPPLREAPPTYRDGPRGGPANGLMLHPQPQQQLPPGRGHENYAPPPIRMPSGSASPPPRQLPAFNERPPVGPGQMSHPRSPRAYPRDIPPERVESGWDRRMPPAPEREWDPREHRGRPPTEYPQPQHPQHQAAMYASRPHSPMYGQQPHRNVSRDRRESPPDASPRSAHPHAAYQRSPAYWADAKQGPGAPPSREVPLEAARRYDPTQEGRDVRPREYEREPQMDRAYQMPSPETMRMRGGPPPPPYASSVRGSESPRMQPADIAPEAKARAGARRKAPPPMAQEVSMAGPPQDAKKERKKRQRRSKEDTPAPQRQDSQYSISSLQGGPSYRDKASSHGSPEPSSNGSNGTGPGSANRSAQPSPTNSAPAHRPPTRSLDEDYDGDGAGAAAEVLMNMASASSYRGGPNDPRSFVAPPMRSPPDSRGPPHMSPHPMGKHPAMVNRVSPPVKRPLSPGPEDPVIEAKRSRVGSMSRRMSSPAAPTTTSTRPSPIPFRQQPTSHSPEVRAGAEHASSYPPSPALPTMLPPHPRPIGTMGAGLAGHTSGPGMPLAPLASARSPPAAASPTEDRMRESRSNSPSAQRMPAKREIVVHPARSPPGSKGTPSPASSHGSAGSHKMVVSA